MKHFKEFIAYASEANLPFLEHMAPGLQISEIETELEISCDEINYLYSWRNGVSFSGKERFNTELCFFFFGYMVPLEKVKYYIGQQKSVPELSGKKMLLIFESGLGDAYFYDYDNLSETFGKIFYYTLDERFKKYLFVQFDSIDRFFKYILRCYQEGVYKFENKEFTLVDLNREYQILLETNPGSMYWDSLADWVKDVK